MPSPAPGESGLGTICRAAAALQQQSVGHGRLSWAESPGICICISAVVLTCSKPRQSLVRSTAEKKMPWAKGGSLDPLNDLAKLPLHN
jgi:hypothetical protein